MSPSVAVVAAGPRVHGWYTGPARAAGANAPLSLADSDGAWLVVSGALNVFAVPCHDGPGSTGGAREFLFRLEAGALSFGFAHAVREAALPVLVLAVGDADTVVAPVSREALQVAATDDPVQVVRSVGEYVAYVSGAVPEFSAEAPVDPDVAPSFAWVRMDAYQAGLLRAIANRLRQHDAEHRDRLTARRQADREAERRALATITSLLARHGELLRDSTGSPLHDALRCLGEVLDVRFRPYVPPPGVKDLSERARAVALASTVGCREVRLLGEWWRRDAGPLLAFTQAGTRDAEGAVSQEQAVVLLPNATRGYDLVHPLTAVRTRLSSELAAGLAPHALQFYRALPPGPARTSDVLRFALRSLRDDGRAMVLAGAAAAAMALVPPVLTRFLFDRIVPAADLSGLTVVLVALIVASASGLLFEWVRAVAALRVRIRLLHDLQLAVLDRLLRLPVNFFRRFAAGDLGRRALGVTTVGDVLGQAALTALLGAIGGLTALLLLFWYSVPLALLSVALLAVNIAATAWVARLSMHTARERQQATGAVSALMLETLRAMAKLRAAAAEPRLVARWAIPFRQQQQASLAFGLRRVHLRAFLAVLDVLSRLLLFAAYAWLSAEGGGSLSTGAFVAFAAAEGTFRAAALAVSETAVLVLEEYPAWERAAPILQAVPESSVEQPDPGPLEGRITISHLSFAYDADGPETLHDVSLDIPAGSFVAIVGPSGSGKSTLLRLLLGFETPQRGSIRYDDYDLQQVDRAAVRRQIGVVLQHASLSYGDVYSNITGSTPRPQSVVWEATRLAGVEDEIRAMPMGLQTLIPDGGAGLSGGQRQRLLIARALIHRPKILFFDEATSALDTRAQRCVSESVATLHATRLVIAHRLSTIRHADHIVVLDQGRVVETGTFESLMERNGLFARLAAQQEP